MLAKLSWFTRGQPSMSSVFDFRHFIFNIIHLFSHYVCIFRFKLSYNTHICGLCKKQNKKKTHLNCHNFHQAIIEEPWNLRSSGMIRSRFLRSFMPLTTTNVWMGTKTYSIYTVGPDWWRYRTSPFTLPHMCCSPQNPRTGRV